MSFTTPCFIRKNTPELRDKLRELGYKVLTNFSNFPCLATMPDDGMYDCSGEGRKDGAKHITVSDGGAKSYDLILEYELIKACEIIESKNNGSNSKS